MFKMVGTLIATLRGSDVQDINAGKKSVERGVRVGVAGRNPIRQDATAERNEAVADIEQSLRHIFAHRDPTRAGSIHLVGLESLRQKLADRWSAISERVHLLAARLLDQYTSPQDTWFRHEGDIYVVVFARLGPEQSRLICAKVVEELQVLLLGEVDTAAITVRTVMHELGSEVMLVPASLKQMLDEASTALIGAARHYPATGDPPPFRHALAEQMGPLIVRYRPVWDVRQQVLSVYIARGCRQRRGRIPLWSYECLDDPHDPQSILDLDIKVVRQAVTDALELYDNSFRFFLSVSIHFESLAVMGRRRELVAVLQAIPAHMYRYLTYHIYGAPPGVPAGRLAEMVTALRPFARTVMVVVDPNTTDLPAVAASGAQIASILLPSGARVERYRTNIMRFGVAAAKHRLRTSVEGVDDQAMEELCEDAGIGFLSGDLIGDWVDVPEHVVRKSRTDFIRQKPVIDRSRL